VDAQQATQHINVLPTIFGTKIGVNTGVFNLQFHDPATSLGSWTNLQTQLADTDESFSKKRT
jgi:hypothetical protein